MTSLFSFYNKPSPKDATLFVFQTSIKFWRYCRWKAKHIWTCTSPASRQSAYKPPAQLDGHNHTTYEGKKTLYPGENILDIYDFRIDFTIYLPQKTKFYTFFVEVLVPFFWRIFIPHETKFSKHCRCKTKHDVQTPLSRDIATCDR